MFQGNSIDTCLLSRVKQITSPGWMHETSARTWCSGKTWKERVGREVGGGIGMGKPCKLKAVSFQCMTKFTTIKKKLKNKIKRAAKNNNNNNSSQKTDIEIKDIQEGQKEEPNVWWLDLLWNAWKSNKFFEKIFGKEMLLLELKEIETGQNLGKSSDFWRYTEWVKRATNMHYISRKGKCVPEGGPEVGKAATPTTGKEVKVRILRPWKWMEFVIQGFTLAWNPFFSPVFPFGMRMSILWCVNPDNWFDCTCSQPERNVPSGWDTAWI